jgi:predicted nucleic acid-binding protein
MIVVDTNIVSYLYLAGDRSQASEELLAYDAQWVAPALWLSEFRNVLALYLRKNILNLNDVLLITQQAEKLLSDNTYEVSSPQVMELVNDSSCSAYDCEFIALAKHLDIPLITADKKLLHWFPTIAKTVESYISSEDLL